MSEYDHRIVFNAKDNSYTVELGHCHWGFTDPAEARLALAMWDVYEAKDPNYFRHLFKAMLLTLGCDSEWTK